MRYGSYHERLRVPWWWHPSVIVGDLLLGTFFVALLKGVVAEVAGWVAFFLVVEAVLLWSSRMEVRVAEDTLEAGGYRLPLAAIRAAYPVLTATEMRAALGTALDPRTILVRRPWIRQAVELVTDPALAGGASAWLISTRHPVDLAVALTGTEGA